MNSKISPTELNGGSTEYPATMHFYDVIEECRRQKPYYSTIPFSAQEALQTNYGSIEKFILMRDIRGHESEFKLEKRGFEVAKHKTKFSDWRNGSRVKKEHFEVIEQFLEGKFECGESHHFQSFGKPHSAC